jgi:hypothetical protein
VVVQKKHPPPPICTTLSWLEEILLAIIYVFKATPRRVQGEARRHLGEYKVRQGDAISMKNERKRGKVKEKKG